MGLAMRDVLVERMAELSAFDQLVAGLQAGQGGLAWIGGEPGVGKSALVDVVAARAGGAGCVVLRGAGEALMEAFPLRLMADCLGLSGRGGGGAAGAAGAVIGGLLRGEGGGAVDPVLAAGERMLELVDRRCAGGPVVLVAEDLQWADEPSLLVWGRLARATDQIPLLVVGTARPVPARVRLDQLRELVADRGGLVAELGPLGPGGVAELAGGVAGGVPGPRLAAALARAGGNPLYVQELAGALLREDAIAVNGGVAELRDGVAVAALPASLNGAIAGRLGFLPAAVHQALQMAAVLGTEFDAAELAAVAGEPAMVLAEVLAEATIAGVISGAGDRFRFRHELIGQVLREQIPVAMRQALHGEFARKLAAAGGGIDAVARHLLAVPGPMEDWVLGWLATAPESALYALPQVSADLLGRAVKSAGDDSPYWEALATRLAQVLHWLGRAEQAGQTAAAVALHTSDVTLEARMRIQVMRSALRMERSRDALSATLHSSEDDSLSAVWRARLGAWSALTVYEAGDVGQGAARAAEVLELATATGDPLTIAYARHAAGMCCGAAARPAHIRAALAALTSQDPESMDLRMLLLNNHLGVSADLGLRDEAEAALAEALPLAERVGTLRGARILAGAVQFCYMYGRWDEALVHLASIDQEFIGAADLPDNHGLGALIALHRGDRDSADAHLHAATVGRPGALASLESPRFMLTDALAMRAEADGDLSRAVALMAAWLTAQPGLHPFKRHDDVAPYLVRLALAAGDRATAEAAAAVAQADLAADRSASRVIGAAFCQALIDDDAGALLTAAADYQKHGWLPLGAYALEEAAVRLAAAADTARARAALTGAVRIYAGLGAIWDMRRADARLRPSGVRRGPRSIQSRATTGWEALTPSEQRIAELVARGLSNPDIAAELFLSRRTVQAHVSAILAKLQARSRLDIIRIAEQHHHSPRGTGTG